MSRPQRSLRLEKRSSRSLSVLSGAPGEIFFDNDNGTLRVYTDTAGDSIILANRQWVTANTFDGDYNSLSNKPTIDLTGLATETYVDDAIAAIPSNDLTGLATETYVDTAVSNLIDTAPGALDTLNELAAALGNDGDFATSVATALSGKQATLVSGTNIKTVNGTSLLGTGDITISGGSSISNVVEDTTPQLGGNLDLNSNTINGTGSIDFGGTLTISDVFTLSSDICLLISGFPGRTGALIKANSEVGAAFEVSPNGNVTAAGFVQFGSLTSTERDALTAANGMVIYNTTNDKFEGYQNGAWINLDNGTAAS